MEGEAVRSTPWSLLTYGTTRAILLVNTVALARILQPSDFGLLALATLAVGVFAFLGELGLGSAFTARPDLDEREQGTVLSIMLIAGAVTAALIASLSPLAANLFSEPRLSPVLAVLSLTVFLNGFTWFYEQVLIRQLEFRRRFFAILSQAIVTLIVAVAAALLGAGVWSLVLGQIAGMVAQGVVQLRLAPYRVRLSWDAHVAREMLRAGRGFMALGALTFVRQNLDYFSVARSLGARPLGYYSMAYRLSDLPSAAIAGPIAKVTFPTFVRMRSRGEDPGTAYLRALRYVALVTAPMAVVLSATARPFTLAIFGESWRPMIGCLGALGVWAGLRSLQVTCAWYLNAIGHAGRSAWLTAISIAVLLPGTLIAARHGIGAVAWVLLGEGVFTLCLYIWFIARAGVAVREHARALWPVVLAATVAWAITRAVASSTAGLVPVVSLGAAIAATSISYLGALLLASPSTLADARNVVLRSFGRGIAESEAAFGVTPAAALASPDPDPAFATDDSTSPNLNQ